MLKYFAHREKWLNILEGQPQCQGKIEQPMHNGPIIEQPLLVGVEISTSDPFKLISCT